MSLDLTKAVQITPPAAPVSDAGLPPAAGHIQPGAAGAPLPVPGAINLLSATNVSPVAAPTNSLDPLAGAGVTLTKIVLAMLSGSLLLLLCSLIYQETRFHDLTTDAYRAAVGSIAATSARNPRDQRFAPILTALRDVEKNPSQGQGLKGAADALSAIDHGGTDGAALEKLTSDIQSLVLKTTATPVDVAKLHEIVVRTETLSNSTTPSGETLELLKARQELLKAYMEATNATRDFWTRTAQMVLLNLLLPVLTALLGYVFASKPSGK